jgi:hypothetical protein
MEHDFLSSRVVRHHVTQLHRDWSVLWSLGVVPGLPDFFGVSFQKRKKMDQMNKHCTKWS